MSIVERQIRLHAHKFFFCTLRRPRNHSNWVHRINEWANGYSWQFQLFSAHSTIILHFSRIRLTNTHANCYESTLLIETAFVRFVRLFHWFILSLCTLSFVRFVSMFLLFSFTTLFTFFCFSICMMLRYQMFAMKYKPYKIRWLSLNTLPIDDKDMVLKSASSITQTAPRGNWHKQKIGNQIG